MLIKQAIWIGSLKGSNALICPDLNLTWENEIFNLLGVTFSINLADMVDLNYSKQIKPIESLFKCYSKRFTCRENSGNKPFNHEFTKSV